MSEDHDNILSLYNTFKIFKRIDSEFTVLT